MFLFREQFLDNYDAQINSERYPVWASLARDFLAIMATSVSSERAFSAAGITISKRRNRLRGDIVEALQFLKCSYKRDLLFREADDPSIASETQLDGPVISKDSDGGWDELVEDIAEIECSEFDMEGDDDDNVLITDIN